MKRKKWLAKEYIEYLGKEYANDSLLASALENGWDAAFDHLIAYSETLLRNVENNDTRTFEQRVAKLKRELWNWKESNTKIPKAINEDLKSLNLKQDGKI